MAAHPTLIYDADCTFCTRCADWVRAHAELSVTVVPWQSMPDLASYGLTPEQVNARVYWVEPDGRLRSGPAAVARALESCGAAWWVVGQAMRTFPWTIPAELVYGAVARNRHLMPGGTEACRVDTEPVTDRARG
ncbi:MAG: DUF393 domain-containing protein [Frankia sp.]|nr:DUF393 domain-containing protein [Frankia sp.]